MAGLIPGGLGFELLDTGLVIPVLLLLGGQKLSALALLESAPALLERLLGSLSLTLEILDFLLARKLGLFGFNLKRCFDLPLEKIVDLLEDSGLEISSSIDNEIGEVGLHRGRLLDPGDKRSTVWGGPDVR